MRSNFRSASAPRLTTYRSLSLSYRYVENRARPAVCEEGVAATFQLASIRANLSCALSHSPLNIRVHQLTSQLATCVGFHAARLPIESRLSYDAHDDDLLAHHLHVAHIHLANPRVLLAPKQVPQDQTVTRFPRWNG